MFGIDSAELLIIAVVALVVIGPKDLPQVMRTIGNFVGRARGMARHFRSGIDTMIREVELEDMEKQWKDNNERIMRDSPTAALDSDWGKPAPDAPPPPAPASADDARPKAPPRRAPRKPRAGNAPPPPAKPAPSEEPKPSEEPS